MNARYTNRDNDPRGPWKAVDATAQGGHGTASQFYSLTLPSGRTINPPAGRCWLYTLPRFNEMVADNRIWFGDSGDNTPAVKRFLSEVKQGVACQTIWKYDEVGHSQEGKKELRDLFVDNVPFDTPKPVRLMKRILQVATDTDSLVLDFYSGSASMAHAVLEKNAEDGGSRRFILVQLPEAASGEYTTLCDVGEERIRRAGSRIAEEAESDGQQLMLGEEAKAILDTGFRVLRIDSSNYRDTFAEPGNQSQATLYDFIDNLKDDRTPEDLLFQVLPSFRIPYSAHIDEFQIDGVKCYNVNDGQLIACFDSEVGTSVIEKIAQERPIYAVFRDASLADDSAAANFEELFKTYSPDTIRRVI